MAVYFAVLNDAGDKSSDSAVGLQPTSTSKILGKLHRGRYVEVEAASVADAQNAVSRVFGNVNTPIVVTEAAWKES